MAEELENLIEDYKHRLKLAEGEQEAMTYNTMEEYVSSSRREERINTKIFCYRTFVTELERLRPPQSKREVKSEIPRFIKHKYNDGSTITSEWMTLMDGEWPYLNSVSMVELHHNCANPTYEKERKSNILNVNKYG